jgi:hypothetical protein
MSDEIYSGPYLGAIEADACVEDETGISGTQLSEPVLHGGLQRARHCVGLLLVCLRKDDVCCVIRTDEPVWLCVGVN